MSEDKELVEVWRQQFENYHGSHARLDNGRYVDPVDQTLWVCWIAAKRSQPIVVLPMVVPIQDGFSGKLKPYFRKQDIVSAITAAGIKYTIGE